MAFTVFARVTPLAFYLTTCLAAPALAQPSQSAPTTAATQEPSVEQGRADLRFMVTEMERRHPNLYHQVDRETFAAAVNELDRRLPTLQRNEIIVGMMRLAAMIGDGHTRVDPRKDRNFNFPSLPLKLYLFEDGLYIRAAAPAHGALVGARVEAIGGIPVAEAIRRATEISSRDNDIGPRLFVPLYLAMPDILHALRLSDRRDTAALTVSRDGRRWTATIAAGAVDPLWPPDTDISLITPEGWVDARRTPQPPLWLQAPLDYHRMIALPDRRALYVQLNMVANIRDQTLTQFGERIAEQARVANPRALILDLRLNQGGNGELRHRFVRELIRAEDEDTRLFVLVGRGTFSASQFILDDLDRLSDAVLIGEPASSRPSSFGDAYRSTLPNSGISLRTSLLWWQSGQNRDPWTWIDLAAPLSFEDYVAGRDPALEAAVGFQDRPSLRERLLAAARTAGVEEVVRIAAAFRDDPANRYADVARELVRAADSLLASDQAEAGLSIATLAARTFPNDVNAALIHAFIAERTGRFDIARHQAMRVLALDPNNRFIRPVIERLERSERR